MAAGWGDWSYGCPGNTLDNMFGVDSREVEK